MWAERFALVAGKLAECTRGCSGGGVLKQIAPRGPAALGGVLFGIDIFTVVDVGAASNEPACVAGANEAAQIAPNRC